MARRSQWRLWTLSATLIVLLRARWIAVMTGGRRNGSARQLTPRELAELNGGAPAHSGRQSRPGHDRRRKSLLHGASRPSGSTPAMRRGRAAASPPTGVPLQTFQRGWFDYCNKAPKRLKWTLVANMRDVPSGVAELKYWAERDPNLVGVYISLQAPGGKLLDNPDLYPLYDAAQSLDLPLLAHGGTARPPYGPGTRDLDGAWFLLHGLSNPWAGMAAMGALIGGGIFDLFPRIRAAIIETAGGWVPAALDRFDTHYLMSPGHVPNLKRMPRDVIAEGRYFHGIDSWERSIEFCVEELGEDMWLFASDWPHGDTAWPEAVQQTVERPRLTETARRKILGENAMRLCPRLRS